MLAVVAHAIRKVVSCFFWPHHIHFGRRLRSVLAGLIMVGMLPILASADEPRPPPITKFFDGAAREIVSSLEAGNGWAIVSDRRKIQEMGSSFDCVRYRIVTKFEKGTTSNDQFYLQIELSEETPWIYTVFQTPTASGPSLNAAKKANEAIALIGESIKFIEAGNAAEKNAEVRKLGEKLLEMYRTQLAALVDLIQKDLRSIQ